MKTIAARLPHEIKLAWGWLESRHSLVYNSSVCKAASLLHREFKLEKTTENTQATQDGEAVVSVAVKYFELMQCCWRQTVTAQHVTKAK